MRSRLVFVACVLMASFATPAFGQELPSVKVVPDVFQAGDSATVAGAAFDRGTIQFFVDEIGDVPLAEQSHDGDFEFLVSFAKIAIGPHRLIACNNRARTGECRQSAFADFDVVAPPATTTTVRPTTTTTVRPTTTTTLPTTRPTTTTRPTPTTTGSSTVTASTTATTTSPPVATASPTTLGNLATVTTIGPIQTTPPVLAGVDDPIGPDPTFDPNPDELAISTTTIGPSLAGNSLGQAPDLSVVAIEVSQGIQSMNSTMPLVADRTTVIRVHVASDGQLPWGPVDGLLLLRRPGEDDLVKVPENGPIMTKRPRTDIDATLNFEVPGNFLGSGELTIDVGVWAVDPSTLDTTEPNPSNNLMQRTVTFHHADVPTIWLAALDDGGGPGPVVNDLLPLLGFAQAVHQDLLDYHPTADVNYEAYPEPVAPGPEAFEPGLWDLGLDQDLDTDDTPGAQTAGARRHEPNIRMAWLMEDLLDDANVLGWVDPSIPTGGYSGWAGYGVSWTKPSAGTPAHELGHNRGLKHVACKDADDDGVPDELKGGAIDPTHPTGLPPQCSLAPISETGYFGLTTEQPTWTVYSNDPADPAAAFPFMSYQNPGWTDPYHWCLLLEEVGVPCSPASIGVPPKVLQPAADCDPEPVGNGIGIDLCLANALPPVEPFSAVEPFGGPIQYAQQTVCQGAMSSYLFLKVDGSDVDDPVEADCTASAAAVRFEHVTLNRGPTDTLFVPADPTAWLVVSGYVDLTTGEQQIQQAEMREEISSQLEQRYLDNLTGVLAGVTPLSGTLSIVDDDDNVMARIPVDLDGAGHGDGSERSDIVGFFQAIPVESACSHCFAKFESLAGESGNLVPAVLAISPTPPVVEAPVVTNTGEATLIEWAASDPDGDALTYDVLWSDDGVEWTHAATHVVQQALSVPHDRRFPGGDDLLIKVVANDGSRAGSATSTPFNAPRHLPLMLVTGAGRPVEQYDTVLLQAQLVDPEDDGAHDAGIRWTSSIDGELGEGRLLRTRDLSAGLHTLTATGRDSDGNEASESFPYEVLPRTTPTRYLDTPDDRAVDFILGGPADAGGVGTARGTPPDAAASGAAGEPGTGEETSASAVGTMQPSSSSGPLVLGGVALAGAAAGGVALSRRRRGLVGSGRVGSRTGP